MRRRSARHVVLGLLLLMLASRGLEAAGESGQVTFATVPVPGAVVTATQGDKHIVTSTDLQGFYRFPDLADGAWTIQVEMVGFEKATEDVTVGPDAAPANVELKLLAFDAIAGTVKAAPPAPPAAPAAARANPAAPSKPAANAPGQNASNGANRAAQPNAANQTAPPSQAPPGSAASAAPAPTSDMNADGLLVNGSVNNGAASPFSQLAAFGNNRRGLRSQYNWNLGLVLGNSALDSRPYSLTGEPTPKPSYTDLQLVGQFGGPVKIPGLQNRANVTLGYQRVSDHNVQTYSGLVPTLAERGGDFSQATNALGAPLQLINPATGLPFPGNMIPSGAISPQAAALLALYPLPNAVGTAINYQAPVLATTRSDAFQSRIIDGINNKTQLFGNFNFQRTTTESGSLFGFTDANRVSNIDAAVNWSHRFSPFTTLRAGYHFTDTITLTTPYFANREDVSGLAGITGNDQTAANWGPPALQFSSSGISALSTGQYASNSDFANAFVSEGTWSHNRHNFTYGGGISLRRLNVFSQQNGRGQLTFTGAATGSDLADFLLGLPGASTIAFGNADKFLRAPTYDAYVTDDWRISPTFTANIGVRWEYEAPMTETEGRLVNLDVAPGFTAVAPVLASNPTGALTGAQYPASLVRPDRRGVQPRVSTAWRPIPGSSLVIRSGYGIYRNTQVYQPIAMLLAQQPPLSTASTVAASPSNPLTLADPFRSATPGVGSTFAVDPNLRVGYAQNWQVSVQRDLPASLTMNVTYLGTKGSHLMQEFLPNTYPAGAVNPCPSCPAGFVYLTSNGHSLRNAGQFQLRRRLRNGLAASVQYTLAKATDNATAFSGPSMSGTAIAQNWLDLAAEEGPSTFDQRHQVVTQVQYTTGQGLGGGAMMTGAKGALYKGWTVLANLTMGSGMPFTPIVLTTVPGTGVVGTIRPSLTGISTSPTTSGYYLNPAAYTTPASGQWGDAGRDSVRGPAQFVLTGSVARSFLLGERLSLDWRFDATNLLNTVVYQAVTPYLGNQFGAATQVMPMRSVKMTMRLRF